MRRRWLKFRNQRDDGRALLISIVPVGIFHIGLEFVPALLVAHFVCVAPGRLVLAARANRCVERGERKLTVYAEDPETRTRELCVWSLDSEDEALACERLRTGERLSRAA